jgi:hypothetical protein
MYTDSVENEMVFLAALLSSHKISTANNAVVIVGNCPNCRKGRVITRCTRSMNNGLEFLKFAHSCDCCGENFLVSRIASDIFFHKPYKMLDTLVTPFGDVHVEVNGCRTSFRYRVDTYEDHPGKQIMAHIIDLDFSDLKQGDFIFCGFDSDVLMANDSDERSVLYSCENEKLILGLCAFEPDDCESYCYELEDYSQKGFGYRIRRAPDEFDETEFYKSKITSLAMSWINKSEYSDPDTTIFLALTCFIG